MIIIICFHVFITTLVISTRADSLDDGIFGFQSENAPSMEDPIVIIQPSNVSSILGNKLKLECIFTHPAECNWLHNGLPVPIGMRHTYSGVVHKSRDCSLIIWPFQLSDAGEWQCRGLINTHFVDSNIAHLAAEDPVLQEGPRDQYVEIDYNVTLFCKFNSIVPKCVWQRDLKDVFITGRYKYFTKTGDRTWDCSMQIINAQILDQGRWRCGIPAVSIGGSGGFWSNQAILTLKHGIDDYRVTTSEPESKEIISETQTVTSYKDSRLFLSVGIIGGIMAVGMTTLISMLLVRKCRGHDPTANIDALSADREGKGEEDASGYLIPRKGDKPEGNTYEDVREHFYHTIPEVVPEVAPTKTGNECMNREPVYCTIDDTRPKRASYHRETIV